MTNSKIHKLHAANKNQILVKAIYFSNPFDITLISASNL